jgi:hypothetical protein
MFDTLSNSTDVHHNFKECICNLPSQSDIIIPHGVCRTTPTTTLIDTLLYTIGGIHLICNMQLQLSVMFGVSELFELIILLPTL